MIAWLAKKFLSSDREMTREMLCQLRNAGRDVSWCDQEGPSDEELQALAVDTEGSLRVEIVNSHRLNAVSMPSKMQTHCRSCGAAVCRSWKCEYCQTAYSGIPTMYGFPISWREQYDVMRGGGPSIDELIGRGTDSGGSR
jgi:hypothetical protein